MAAPPQPRQTRSMNEAPHTQGTSPSPNVTRFFDWVRATGIDRGHDRWFAGVCGGIAHRTGLDPLIVRGIAIVLAILGAPVLLAYAIGWALLPNQSGRIHAEQAFRGVFEPAMIAIGALILFTIIPFSRGLWWEGPPLAWGMPNWLSTTLTVGWTIAVIIGIIWLVVYLLRRVPAPDSAFRSPPSAPSGPPASGYSPAAASASFTAPTPASTGPSTAPPQGTSSSFVSTPTSTMEAPVTADTAATGPGSADGAPSVASTAAFVGAATAATPPTRSAWDAVVDQTYGTLGSKTDRAASAHHGQTSHHTHTNRHPGAGFTAIMLGLGLTIGAAASVLYSIAFDGGVWSDAALLVGLAFTLGVLALGIVIAGIRGRTSGAMGGFAFLAATGLLLLGVLPQGTQFAVVGAPTWSVSASPVNAVPGYALGAGVATVDLTALDNARAADDRTIDVWLGFGQTELVLPNDRPVNVEVNSFIGGLDYSDASSSNQSNTERGGILLHDSRTFNGSETLAVAHIRVWTFIGQVTVVDAH